MSGYPSSSLFSLMTLRSPRSQIIERYQKSKLHLHSKFLFAAAVDTNYLHLHAGCQLRKDYSAVSGLWSRVVWLDLRRQQWAWDLRLPSTWRWFTLSCAWFDEVHFVVCKIEIQKHHEKFSMSYLVAIRCSTLIVRAQNIGLEWWWTQLAGTLVLEVSKV